MGLILKGSVQGTQDPTLIYFADSTGLYDAVTNPGGWGSPNDDADTIGSAFLSGSYQTCPFSPVVPIPQVLVFPNPVAVASLPYLYNQSYALSASMFGFTTWANGIYTWTYTVYPIQALSITLAGGSPDVAVGDIITAPNAKYLVVTTTPTVTVCYLTNLDDPDSGAFTASPSGAHGTCGTQGTPYTCTVVCEVINGLICCIGNKLSNIDCKCGCGKNGGIDKLFENFMYLMASQMQLGAGKNGEALQSICCVSGYCSNCGCG